MSKNNSNSTLLSFKRYQFSPIVIIKHYDVTDEAKELNLVNYPNLSEFDDPIPNIERDNLISPEIKLNPFPINSQSLNNLLLGKKSNMVSLHYSSTNSGTSMQDNNLEEDSKMQLHFQFEGSSMIYLNEVMINGSKLNYLPKLYIQEEDLMVILRESSGCEDIKITGNGSYSNDIPNLTNMMENQEFKEEFKSQMKIFESENEMKIPNYEVEEVIKYLYSKIKYNLEQIQNNQKLGKRKSFNKQFILKTKRYIDKCNKIFNIIKKCLKACRNSIKNKKQNEFFCQFCDKNLISPQALGGHMSRCHPNQSQKYKLKVTIHRKRLEHREALKDSKRILLERYNYNYDQIISNAGGKKRISQFISTHVKEFKKILLHLKKERHIIE